jgi:hypothetical protein
MLSLSWAMDSSAIKKNKNMGVRIFTDNVDYSLNIICYEKGIEICPPSATPAYIRKYFF